MKTNSRFENLPWIRVTKSNPCPICESPDWCVYNEKGVVLCMRHPSPRPSKGNAGGWIHNTGETTKIVMPYRKPEIREEVDFKNLWKDMEKVSTPNSLMIFAEKLGVDPMALYSLGCTWSIKESAWAFAMKDDNENIIGIRLRSENGQKWAVKGSRAGLFIPNVIISPGHELMITEGPSDAAAALCMGYQAIGRPSCQGQEKMIRDYVKRKGFKKAIILADNDDPGLIGASRLQSEIAVTSCVVTLPCKDLRQFYGHGGNKMMIESMLKDKIWTKK